MHAFMRNRIRIRNLQIIIVTFKVFERISNMNTILEQPNLRDWNNSLFACCGQNCKESSDC